ncbi:MAG: NUDIX domain-containing protein [Candidatus Thermoplasmatota archaeon]|nr:NUDIX domain-containing protein [Candidatus Thermoplasmatota archaeon]
MKEDEFVLGEGKSELLQLVDEKGSISAAAEDMDMSYRHAWGLIKEIEERTGEELIKSQRGGSRERGSALTPAGKQLLSDYNAMKEEHKSKVYRNPSLTVDGILTEGEKIVLIERKNPPFEGSYALPGGFVEYEETVEEAVVREVEEETGFKTEIEDLVGVYSSPDRDPRGHMVSTVFSLKMVGGELEEGSDAASAKFFDLEDLPDLAFDHQQIIKDFLVLSSDQPETGVGPS